MLYHCHIFFQIQLIIPVDNMAAATRTQLNFLSGAVPSMHIWNPAHHAPLQNGSSDQSNQLLFNLNVASNPTNITARFNNPGPLVIEKLGGAARQEGSASKVSPLKFSVVSEERLSLAIQLARRDLKNKIREDELRKQIEAIEAAEMKSQKGKKKTKKGQNVRGKSIKLSQGKVVAARQLPIRERGDIKQTFRSVKTQTPPKKIMLQMKRQSGAPQQGLLLQHTPSSDNGGAGEVRNRKRQGDAVTPPSQNPRESPMSKQTREIKRLRQELKDYIGKIEELSRQGKSCSVFVLFCFVLLCFCLLIVCLFVYGVPGKSWFLLHLTFD